MDLKKWYRSKTLWINLIAIVALVAQSQLGFAIAPNEQGCLLAVINLILRAFTNTGLTNEDLEV